MHSDQVVRQIAAEHIRPGPNDRKTFPEEQLRELAESIRTNGLAQPIVVRHMPDGDYEVVAGERRLRAMTAILHMAVIPCLVRHYTDEEASAVMLSENISRQDLNPIEEAQAYASRKEKYSWSDESVAQLAGVSMERLRKRLSLLRLIPEAQQLVATGNLPLGQAECCTRLDSNRQISALRILQSATASLTLAAFREICSQLLAEQQQDGLFALTQFWVEQVEKATVLPRRGKHAVTYAPTDPMMPHLATSQHDTTATLFEKYIVALMDAGKASEAAAVGTLYTRLVKTNFLAVPERSELLRRQGETEAR